MKRVRSGWEHAILVCRKCEKREGVALAKVLRAQPGAGRKRKARVGVAEVGCLGVCPKRGMVVIDTREPNRWRVVARDADLDQLAPLLFDPSPAKAGAQ